MALLAAIGLRRRVPFVSRGGIFSLSLLTWRCETARFRMSWRREALFPSFGDGKARDVGVDFVIIPASKGLLSIINLATQTTTPPTGSGNRCRTHGGRGLSGARATPALLVVDSRRS